MNMSMSVYARFCSSIVVLLLLDKHIWADLLEWEEVPIRVPQLWPSRWTAA
jgi:hypothetical protein